MRSELSWRRLVTLCGLLSLPLAVGACADFARGAPSGAEPPVDDALDGGGGAALSFAGDVHGLLMERCHGCHSAGGSASTTAYVLSGESARDYEESLKFVDETTPSSSRLVSKAAGAGHGGGAVFAAGSDEYDRLVLWITQGALP